MNKAIMFRAIELMGGPCDGERFCNCSDEIVTKDENGAARQYVATVDKTGEGRVKFAYDGLAEEPS